MWVVYTEIHENENIDRWYYGTYKDRDRANEVALELGNEYPIYHCVVSLEDSIKFNIKNLP